MSVQFVRNANQGIIDIYGECLYVAFRTWSLAYISMHRVKK